MAVIVGKALYAGTLRLPEAMARAEGGVERAIAELVYIQDPRVQQLRKTSKPEEILRKKGMDCRRQALSPLLRSRSM
jgi:hypothetical protein